MWLERFTIEGVQQEQRKVELEQSIGHGQLLAEVEQEGSTEAVWESKKQLSVEEQRISKRNLELKSF